ncbi:MAG: formate--tetrahydrofolate ligase, partial [Haloquadratum sp.]|nr:formate--tetrahydrofolate ligase [Haloquadratum sp.]
MSETPAADAFPSDYEIAQAAEMVPIWDLLRPYELGNEDLEYYGEYKAKLNTDSVARLRSQAQDREQNLVLVTGMTPTPLGEGKTVTTVGLGQTLNAVGKEAMIAIREPSLGPVFGVKGGAA